MFRFACCRPVLISSFAVLCCCSVGFSCVQITGVYDLFVLVLSFQCKLLLWLFHLLGFSCLQIIEVMICLF